MSSIWPGSKELIKQGRIVSLQISPVYLSGGACQECDGDAVVGMLQAERVARLVLPGRQEVAAVRLALVARHGECAAVRNRETDREGRRRGRCTARWGVDFEDKAAACATLQGAGGRWEVGRRRLSANVGVRSGVEGNTHAIVIVAATEVGGEKESRPGGVERRHEDVAVGVMIGIYPAALLRLDGIHGREVGGPGPAGHVGVAGAVHSDARPAVEVAPSEVGRVDQRRAGSVE